MNNGKLKELNKMFVSLEEARSLNSHDFPYCEVGDAFNSNLKVYLKEVFHDDIEFDREETFAYIQAHYKGVGIEINTYDGIILTIEDLDRAPLVNDFKDIFNEIVGMNPICSYHYCSKDGDTKTVFPTVEWSFHPEERLFELIMRYDRRPGEWKENFEDYYTCSIIQSLGEDLFTVEGYKKLFESHYCRSYEYTNHKLKQIQKLNPNVSTGAIWSWMHSTSKMLELSEEVILKKLCIDDGK